MKTLTNPIVNALVIEDAIETAQQVVRVTEARSVRAARRRQPEVFAAQDAEMIAFIEAEIEAEELALRPEGEVLVSFLDEDEDFIDAETGESLFGGFSVRF